MRKILSAFTCISILALVLLPCPAVADALPTVNMQIGQHVIKVEFANTESQRATGLMFRKQLDENSGMLFDYHMPASVCMWMKNTFIPLSVAFIDQNGIILNIEDMQPLTLTPHCSRGRIRYVLEMNQGWFASREITPGSSARIIP